MILSHSDRFDKTAGEVARVATEAPRRYDGLRIWSRRSGSRRGRWRRVSRGIS